jgi:hypothetical protein
MARPAYKGVQSPYGRTLIRETKKDASPLAAFGVPAKIGRHVPVATIIDRQPKPPSQSISTSLDAKHNSLGHFSTRRGSRGEGGQTG